jgi:hypothetical protein
MRVEVRAGAAFQGCLEVRALTEFQSMIAEEEVVVAALVADLAAKVAVVAREPTLAARAE